MKEKIGIASDHGGFALKEFLRKSLEETYEIVDYVLRAKSPSTTPPSLEMPAERFFPVKFLDSSPFAEQALERPLPPTVSKAFERPFAMMSLRRRCPNAITTRMYSF